MVSEVKELRVDGRIPGALILLALLSLVMYMEYTKIMTPSPAPPLSPMPTPTPQPTPQAPSSLLYTCVQIWKYPFGGTLRGIIEDPQSGHVMELHKFFFLDSENNVAELIPDMNLFTKWTIPTPDSGASFGISIMNLRRVFFAEPNASKIGRLDEPEGTFTEWTVPESSNGESQPYGIVVAGFPGPVYFTDVGGDRIGSLSPSTNGFTMWSLPSRRKPSGITICQGAMCFLEDGNRIGRLDPGTNVLTEWTVPASFGSWSGYIVTSQGFLFFTSDGDNRIGRFDPSTNLFTEWVVPTADGAPKGILVDPLDPSLRAYFVESDSGKIGLLDTMSHGPGTVVPFTTIKLDRISTVVTPVTTVAIPVKVKVSPTTTMVDGVVNDAFVEWTLPVPKVGLEALAPSMFRLLFTHNSGIVGRFQTVVKTITEYTLPADIHPQRLSIYLGLFFTEPDNKIGRLNFAETTITQWMLPSPDARPFAFAPRYSDHTGGVIFFTEEGANNIACFDPNTNTLKEWTVPTPESSPRGITFVNNVVYFAEFGANKIGRLDPITNTFTEWVIPTASSGTSYVAFWLDGLIFTETYANKIGKLDPSSNTIEEWTIPTADSFPTELTGSESGHLYFTEGGSNKIGRLAKYSFGTVFEEWTISAVNPDGSTSLPSIDRQVRNVFFLELVSNKIGFFDPSLNTGAPEKIVEPTVVGGVTVTPTTVQVTPVETTLTPEVKSVAVTWTTVIGEASDDGFVMWAIPTSGSEPLGIVNTDGFGVFFTESGTNKIGRLSGDWF